MKAPNRRTRRLPLQRRKSSGFNVTMIVIDDVLTEIHDDICGARKGRACDCPMAALAGASEKKESDQ